MKIHLDIRDDIPPNIALECVKQVVEEGRISAQGKMYAYATIFNTTYLGEIVVAARPYRKSDCFIVYKNQTAKDKWNSRTKKKFDIPGYENVVIHDGNAKGGILKTIDADKVIAWLVANICDYDYYVKLFKKDFGL